MTHVFDVFHRNKKLSRMTIQKKFIDAVEKYLADKKAKNIYQLCLASGVDQAAFSSFIKTHQFLAGNGEKPARVKNDIYLDSAGKVIEYMGGQLIFPWDKETDDIYMEAARLREELATAKNEIAELKIELKTCKEISQRFENIIRDKMPSYTEMPAASRQDKSSAS